MLTILSKVLQFSKQVIFSSFAPGLPETGQIQRGFLEKSELLIMAYILNQTG